MYITWFCYIWRVVVLSFIPSTPKLVNFANFLESRSWGKNMSTPKLVNFPSFGFQELRKNMYVYIYKYIICIYVHMYITWFCYIWRVVVLSFIPSARKLVNFLHFLDSRNWEKTCVYINIYIICIYVHMYICTYVYYMILLYLEGSGSKFHSVSTKTSQFSSFFGFQELRKNMCIYKYIYNMYICTYVYMYICILHDFAIFGG